MIYTVSSRDLGRIRLGETDTVASVLQNIAILLSTWKNTVPLYRAFGISRESLDRPMEAAQSLLVAEVEEEIAEYEPRATVLSVTFEIDENAPGKLIPIVEVEVEAADE